MNVPIADVRIKFNLGAPSYDQLTVVIILNIGVRAIRQICLSIYDGKSGKGREE